MLIGYARVSKADGSQTHDLQRDALIAAGVAADQIYEDSASGRRDDRPGLDACLKALRAGDTLVIWKLDRLARSLKMLITTADDLACRGIGLVSLTESLDTTTPGGTLVLAELTTREIGLKVLAGEGASIDTTTANGRLIFGIFAALAEFERELIVERTKAGLAAARARGRKGGRPFKMTPAKLRLAQAAMGKPETVVADLCAEIGITRQTLYRFVDPNGQLRAAAERLTNQRGRSK